MNQIEATLTRIQGHKGVHGIVICGHDGSVIRSTLDNIQTQQYSTLVTQLAAKGKGVVRDLDPEMHVNLIQKRAITNASPTLSGTDSDGDYAIIGEDDAVASTNNSRDALNKDFDFEFLHPIEWANGVTNTAHSKEEKPVDNVVVSDNEDSEQQLVPVTPPSGKAISLENINIMANNKAELLVALGAQDVPPFVQTAAVYLSATYTTFCRIISELYRRCSNSRVATVYRVFIVLSVTTIFAGMIYFCYKTPGKTTTHYSSTPSKSKSFFAKFTSKTLPLSSPAFPQPPDTSDNLWCGINLQNLQSKVSQELSVPTIYTHDVELLTALSSPVSLHTLYMCPLSADVDFFSPPPQHHELIVPISHSHEVDPFTGLQVITAAQYSSENNNKELSASANRFPEISGPHISSSKTPQTRALSIPTVHTRAVEILTGLRTWHKGGIFNGVADSDKVSEKVFSGTTNTVNVPTMYTRAVELLTGLREWTDPAGGGNSTGKTYIGFCNTSITGNCLTNACEWENVNESLDDAFSEKKYHNGRHSNRDGFERSFQKLRDETWRGGCAWFGLEKPKSSNSLLCSSTATFSTKLNQECIATVDDNKDDSSQKSTSSFEKAAKLSNIFNGLLLTAPAAADDIFTTVSSVPAKKLIKNTAAKARKFIQKSRKTYSEKIDLKKSCTGTVMSMESNFKALFGNIQYFHLSGVVAEIDADVHSKTNIIGVCEAIPYLNGWFKETGEKARTVAKRAVELIV
ncbi:hypothetical protein HK100_006057 [Physocladia obscura]|uniref:Roadblock/LAMTOR2 domain-containing protein n=1 Tax=Physocladia obscura TaxID=109957 RepID=A0AAD5XIP4_9FUNG|nr:hypothetical protein HK100_006057 [Physocladia obscura]